MTRQQSNVDLAGSLAATLTPRVPHADAQPFRASQNSGLFDVGALYAEAFEQVARRAQSDPRLNMPLARAMQPTWPASARWPQPALSYVLEPEVPIEYAETNAHRSPGVGWFGVAVAWLATVTTSALIATTLPAHAPTHARALAAVAAIVATPPASPVVTAPSSPSAPVVASVALPAVPTVPLSALPAAVLSAPVAPAVAAALPVAHPAPKKAAPKGVALPTAHPPHPGATPAVVAAPTAVASTPPRPSAPSKPVVAAPVPASTAGMSLDDLIRREVQAESTKHH